MREYLKILSSIIAALLSLALLFSMGLLINEFFSDSENMLGVMLFPFIVVGVGFVLFGIAGSALWFVFFSMIAKYSLHSEDPMMRHVLAACLSTIVCWLIIGLIIFDEGFQGLYEAASLLILVGPVVAVSLVWYKLLYLRHRALDDRRSL
jgi:hypothetical protein